MARKGLLAFALLAAHGCATTTAQGTHRPRVQDDPSTRRFAEAEDLFAAQRWDEAAAAFSAYLREFPRDDQADEARLRRAQSLENAGKLAEALTQIQEDLERHPTSRFRQAEAIELGIVQARLGKTQEAAETLKPALDQMTEEDKKKAAPALAEAYARSGQAGEALRWSVRALQDPGEGAERELRMEGLFQMLEAAPAADVARLVAELDHGSPAWAPAALKLARVQLHLGDRTHAAELLREVFAAASGTPFAESARNLQALGVSAPVKPTRIGAVLPLTGELKVFAEPILDAISLRIDLQGRGPVQIEVKDSHNDPDGAARAVEELARDGVIAIVGPIGLAEGPAAAARAQQLGVPLISLSRAEGLTAMGPFVFRNMLTNSAQAKAVADYAQRKLNARSFAVLQPDSPYGDEMVRYFWDALDAGGAQVTAFERYPRETTTFKPFVSRMVGRANLSERKEYAEQEERIIKEIADPYRRRKELARLRSQTNPIVDFDALFIPDAARTVRLIAPAIAAEDVVTAGCDARDLELIKKTKGREDLRAVQLLGTNLWDSEDLVDERMGAARYVQCAIFADGFFPQSQRSATRRFVEEYGAAFHKQPSFLEAHGHDAAGILRELIERRHPQTREEMRELLSRMERPYAGAAGDTRFGPEREANKTLFWLWINRGVIQEFDPDGPPPVPPVAPTGQATPALRGAAASR